jgi:hexosaminidase
MRPRAFLAAIASILLAASAQAAEPAVIPNPASVVVQQGEFRLSARTPIVVASEKLSKLTPGMVSSDELSVRRVAAILADLVRRTHRWVLPVMSGPRRDGAINLRLEGDAGLGAEGYRLEAEPRRVTITASTPAGLFHGATTLWQLMAGGKPGSAASIPAVSIADAPRFAWRGIMLDSARHYQSPDFIRRFIDAMAMHKLNVLHWHLTDDQAWRLEIRKYPALTAVGAWRVPAGAARLDLDPATGKPRLYGGYYSQETVRSLVAYAAERAITIVPEIEMPGHASAALAAYPALAATSQPPGAVPADWGIYPNVYSLDDSTFAFLEDVLTEVMELFPSPYIHVGGDEVEKTQWRESPRGQALMRGLGIDDGAKLQVYFTQRIARFLDEHGRRLVGWDEILEPGLPATAVVMSWRGIDGALQAAAKGHDTVLSPWPTLYFDNRQGTGAAEPPGRARVISVEDVYAFEPMPAKLAADERRHILGLQGNVWTEHIRTEERVGWMTFPRAAAIAELGWSQPERREWGGFRRRLEAMPALYAALGMPYAKSAFDVAGLASSQNPTMQRRTSRELKLCTDHISLVLEDDAPLRGPRATFLVDIQNPCWIFPEASLDRVRSIVASVGQVPFNFQIGEDVKKITFPPPATAEGELEVHLESCDGKLLARLPLAPAAKSDGVTTLPRAEVDPPPGKHDLCLRFAQRGVDPLWVIDSIRLVEAGRE